MVMWGRIHAYVFSSRELEQQPTSMMSVQQLTSFGSITLPFHKTRYSNFLCWKEELLRKPQMLNLCFTVTRKIVRQVLASIVVQRAMTTLLLTCITSTFQTTQTFNLLSQMEDLLTKSQTLKSRLGSWRKAARQVFESPVFNANTHTQQLSQLYCL